VSERRGALAKTDSAPPARLEAAEPPVEDFISRKWGRSALRSRAEEFDDFGLDPSFEQRVKPVVEFLYRSYFRTTAEGVDNVPAEGRCIVVANHSGALPLDGLMLRAALRIDHKAKRDLRWLAEDFVYYLPFAGVFMNRVGAVRACPENAERLLEKESIVGVFPEGVHGIKKLFQERYRLQRFGRGGYIRLCLRMRAPIVPCAIIGAEESSPLLYRLEGLTELLGLPYFPITPTFPFLGPAGLLPAPTKWRMRFGEPINLDNYGPEAADDHVLVGRLSERVRSSIQAMLDSGLRERRSVWFG
jgi:1-acyl-sn-glycerol-3-phosphate acyltransferase